MDTEKEAKLRPKESDKTLKEHPLIPILKMLGPLILSIAILLSVTPRSPFVTGTSGYSKEEIQTAWIIRGVTLAVFSGVTFWIWNRWKYRRVTLFNQRISFFEPEWFGFTGTEQMVRYGDLQIEKRPLMVFLQPIFETRIEISQRGNEENYELFLLRKKEALWLLKEVRERIDRVRGPRGKEEREEEPSEQESQNSEEVLVAIHLLINQYGDPELERFVEKLIRYAQGTTTERKLFSIMREELIKAQGAPPRLNGAKQPVTNREREK